MDIAARLARIEIFAPLQGRALERLSAGAAAVDLAAGETSNALESGAVLLFIESGRLRVSAMSRGRIGFADLGAGEVQGLVEAVAGNPVPPCAVLALDATTALALRAEAVVTAVRSNAASSFALARRFAAGLADQAAASDPLQKVYRDILRAARPIGDSRWTVDPLPRHRDLAASAGVEEGDAASAIAHLVRIGVARRRYPALDIEDREALQALAR
ncbi:MAG: hypothetical protein IT548_13950 [Alphaproteobacteria bacterium]|nr:hypothetical protein [Alphaproteobacteria bacterium]